MLKKGTSPLLDRGTVLVSLAVAIALGATSMSDIALLAHLSPVLGAAPSGPTARRALDLAGGTRARPHRPRTGESLALGTRVPCLLAAAPCTASTRLTTTNSPYDKKEEHPGAVGAGAHPGTPGTPRTTRPEDKQTRSLANRHRHLQ
jgi:hypothetical protein